MIDTCTEGNRATPATLQSALWYESWAAEWAEKALKRLRQRFRPSWSKLWQADLVVRYAVEPDVLREAYLYIGKSRHGGWTNRVSVARKLCRLGELDEAERLLREELGEVENRRRKKLAGNPHDPTTLFDWIDLLVSTGRHDEAEPHQKHLAWVNEVVDVLDRATGTLASLERSWSARAGSFVEVMEPDERPLKAMWAIDLPISRGIGFALLTDRRVIVVQDHDYLGLRDPAPAVILDPDSPQGAQLIARLHR
ncbi:hypothetical protein [Kribbella sp. NPDC006257]|uniref:hypothetical protein n=1 Tax=Kribbella sp. NPDC006257 TaxID=3156738 RepID=UPI0033ADFEA1